MSVNLVKQNHVFATAFTLTLIFLASLAVNTQLSRASKTLLVPDNYSTITAAVEHTSPGDIVEVRSGVYCENVKISKSISVLGQDSQTTVIIGNGGVERGGQAVITLAADSVKLSGFTIESSNYPTTTNYASGIFVEGDKCSITGNNIRNTYIGIFCATQSS